MHKLLVLCLSLAAGTALAHNCPNEIKAIDAKLSSSPSLSKDTVDKVMKLRNEGQSLHEQGKHGDSMKVLGDAKKLLGI